MVGRVSWSLRGFCTSFGSILLRGWERGASFRSKPRERKKRMEERSLVNGRTVACMVYSFWERGYLVWHCMDGRKEEKCRDFGATFLPASLHIVPFFGFMSCGVPCFDSHFALWFLVLCLVSSGLAARVLL